MKFTISFPDLALLSFEVTDSEVAGTDVVVAQYALPFRCIRQGYRVVPLDLVGGTTSAGYLFCHVSMGSVENAGFNGQRGESKGGGGVKESGTATSTDVAVAVP